jgi:diguanylate cyclase (GGDEF)-like protein
MIVAERRLRISPTLRHPDSRQAQSVLVIWLHGLRFEPMTQLANNTLRHFYIGLVPLLRDFAITLPRWAIRNSLVAWAILWLLLPMVASAAASPLVLSGSTPRTEVWPYVTVLPDGGKNLGIRDAMGAMDQFAKPDSAYGTLGLQKDAMWLHIPVSVSSDSDGFWILDIDYPVLNRIDVYAVHNQAIVIQRKLGSLQPPEDPRARGRSHAVSLDLQPGTRYDLYLRVESKGALILPITLNKQSAFLVSALAEQMLQGLLTGLALCLLVYSLAQWVTLGEHMYIKYAILISGSLLFSLLQFGIGSQYLWPGNMWAETHMAGLSALIAATGSFLFIEHALKGPNTLQWFSWLMKAGAFFTVFFAVCFSFDLIDVYIVTAIISSLGLAPALLGLPGAISRARRGDSVGFYFLLAWAAYFVTTAVLIEVIKGRVDVSFWTLHSFQFGATFDMLIFMRVLGLQTKALQTAAQHAKREHDNLHSMAHTDPLTGLSNRRGLNASMPLVVQQAHPDHLTAIYMLDLDGFKQINDQHGHDVGDELLIAVAERLRANVRSSDIIARLGGDEFVVVSSGLNSAWQAHELGEKLIKSFSETFVLSNQVCRISMTVGYALAPLDGTDAFNLLKLADSAMYNGKNDGKYCVRRVIGLEQQPSS